MKTVRKILEPLALASAISLAVSAHAQAPLHSIDIQSQSLGSALNQLSAQTGTVIIAPTDLVQGLNVKAVTGDFTSLTALRKLLKNSGLSVNQTASGALVVAKGSETAETPPRLEQHKFSTITVTGENIERKLLDTNTSTNVQTDAEITRSNDQRIRDVFSRAANINSISSGVAGFNFSVRGISSGGVGGAGDGALASLSVDGAAFKSQQLARGYNSLFDVEQVEILRGPQSTGQARNSLAGAVVVSTKDPEFEQDTQAIATVGNYGTYELGVAHTGPINDELAYRIAVQRLSSDGFVENPTLGIDDYTYSQTDTVRAKLLYQPAGSPLEVLLSHAHVQADARNDSSTTFPDTRRFVTDNPFGDGYMDSTQDVTTLKITYELNDAWNLEAQTAYNRFLSEDLNTNYATSIPDRNQAWFATADQTEWNQSVRFFYEGDKIRSAFGAFYSDDNNTSLRDGVGAINPFGNGLDVDLVLDSPVDTKTKAIFGEIDFEAMDKLTFTLGGRYEQVDIDSISTSTVNLVLGPPSPYTVIVPNALGGSLNGSQDFSVFLPKAGVTYALDDDQRVGFTYSEGYRQGGVTINLQTLLVDQYDPEFVKNYELSYKGEFDNGLSANANLFYMDWTDQQLLERPLGSLISQTLNAGESTVYGGELELAFRDGPWDSYATFGYAKTEFDEFVSNGTDYSGNEFPNGPQVTAAIGGFYTVGNWTYGAEANYRSGFYTAINNTFKAPSLTHVDLSAAYAFDGVTVRGFISNVFDKVVTIGETYTIQDVPHRSFSDPRTFGLQVMYGF